MKKPKKEYISLIKSMKEIKKTPSFETNVSVAGITKNGELIRSKNNACHAIAIKYSRYNWFISEVVNQIKEQREEDAILYFEWLFNYSPYKEVYITKNAKKVVKNTRQIVIDLEAPDNLFTGACIFSRFPTENFGGNGYYRRLRVWADLVRSGVHPSFAFSLSNALYINRVFTEIQLLHEVYYGGHSPLSFIDKNYLCFYNNKRQFISNRTFRESGIIGGMHRTWENKQTNPPIFSKLKNSLIVEGKLQQVNPFKGASLRKNLTKYEEVLEAITYFSKDFVKKGGLKWKKTSS